jgi:phenylalanyl-tRNA synthetase beta chain
VRDALEKVAKAAVGKTFELGQVELFDVYDGGSGLPEGRKSLAFSMSFRSLERTLTDEEVNKVFAKILTDIPANTPYTIRK